MVGASLIATGGIKMVGLKTTGSGANPSQRAVTNTAI